MAWLDLSWLQWIGALAAAAVVGTTKAGFGVGSLALVLMTVSLGRAEDMLPVLLLVLICGDFFAIVHYRGRQHWRNLVLLVPGCVAGVIAGWGLFGAMAFIFNEGGSQGASAGLEAVLSPVVGAVALVFLALQLVRELGTSRLTADPVPYRPKVWHGVTIGCAAGVTSTLAHVGGPLIALFLIPQRLPKDVFVGTTVTYFLIGNLLKVPPYALMGMFTPARLGTSLVLLPAVIAGGFTGLWLHKKVGDRAFRYVVYALTFLLALKVLFG